MSGSLRSLRELNRLRVLETVGARGQVSRADIARQTGLARSTVSSLVGELQPDGLVFERPAATPRARGGSAARGGRGPAAWRGAPAPGGVPPVLLSLDPGAGAVVGLHFDHGAL